MNSMTGYGRASGIVNGRHMVVEIRSVNGRFLEPRIRLPQKYEMFEPKIRDFLRGNIHRGSVDVSIQLLGETEGELFPKTQHKKLRSLVRSLTSLKKELGLAGEIDLRLLLSFKDSLVSSSSDSGRDWEGVKKLLSQAFKQFQKMRGEEGKNTKKSIGIQLGHISQTLEEVKRRVPEVTQEFQHRFRERIQKLLGDLPSDPQRLEQEVALWAQRSDITEEIHRLESHISQFEKSLTSSDSVGRKLDFLLQEMNREINTLGSKTSDSKISQYVVEMKSSLEKMKEQIANVE